MYKTPHFEHPPELKEKAEKARRLEWITIGYLISVSIVMYLTLGSSQAMKTAFLEDVLSLIPAVAFLIAQKINARRPNDEYPYAYHQVFEIAFFAGSLTLLSMGLFLVYDSVMVLIKQEHPTIPSVTLFGQTFWLGWVAFLSLAYSAVPAYFLGRAKRPLAEQLHNKILKTDADTQAADYRTAGAAMLGIALVGFGWWWADAVAALFISVSVLKDGFSNTKNALQDLIDRYPKTVQGELDPLIEEVRNLLLRQDWIDEADVRFREYGQIYFGEGFVVPRDRHVSNMENMLQTVGEVKKLSWRIHDFHITMLPHMEALKEEG